MNSVNFLRNDPWVTAASLEALAHDMRLLAGGSAPDLNEAPQIENWRLVRRSVFAMDGVMHGHPIIGEGHRALSSELFAFDPQRRWARTLSRYYVLGAQAAMEG